MKISKDKLRLYVVTDRSWLGDNTLEEQVEKTILSGASFIQIREKKISFVSYLELAKSIKQITNKYGVPFVVNDDLDIAKAVNADGIHVGQDDIPVQIAREKLGANKILGVSVQTVEQARLAKANGADYLGVGTVFPTSTKEDAQRVSIDTVKEICDAVDIPVIAIGGICERNVLELKGSGIAGVAVISAIFASNCITTATKRLRELADKL